MANSWANLRGFLVFEEIWQRFGFQPPNDRQASTPPPTNLDSKLARSPSHLLTLPVVGWARIDGARQIAGSHCAVNNEQAANLCLNAAISRKIRPNSDA
jgi:hypothetical protein